MVLHIFSLDGNIGSGKSTLIKLLEDKQTIMEQSLLDYHDIPKKIIFLQEPVVDWKNIKDEKNINLIENYYVDQKKWGFSFQITTLISRISQLKNINHRNKNIIVITERSICSDKNVFCKMLYDDKIINTLDYNIYNRWYEEFIKDYPLSGHIYLKTDAKKAYERVLKRKRNEEEGLPIEYLIKCNDYHNNWLMNKNNKLVIDGNEDIPVGKNLPNKWLLNIIDYIEEKI